MDALASGCWVRLEEVSCSCTADLFILGLPCHIRSIHIQDTAVCLALLPETMRYARPVKLYLRTEGSVFASEFVTYIQQSADGFRDLSDLEIMVSFSNKDINSDVASLLVSLFCLISLNESNLVVLADTGRCCSESPSEAMSAQAPHRLRVLIPSAHAYHVAQHHVH